MTERNVTQERQFVFRKAPDPYRALGLAVERLSKHKAFGDRKFREWTRILIGQINRGTYAFVMEDKAIVGFVGWVRTTTDLAEGWLNNEEDVGPGDKTGGAVIVNVIEAENRRAAHYIYTHAYDLEEGEFTVYAKRFYDDGGVRRVKVAAPAGKRKAEKAAAGPTAQTTPKG